MALTFNFRVNFRDFWWFCFKYNLTVGTMFYQIFWLSCFSCTYIQNGRYIHNRYIRRDSCIHQDKLSEIKNTIKRIRKPYLFLHDINVLTTVNA